jgi:predicted DNA-binding antitoxin AbrB/MazE fold protein
MALPKKIVPMGETFHAVFENGVLRPLRRLRLKQKSRVLITLYSEPRWRSDFERLLTRMRSRTKAVPQEIVEAEIARARDEVKTKRRAARRSA